jgi:hypothetical protein
MSENDQAIAKRGAGPGNASFHLDVWQAEVLLRQCLTLGNVLLLELGQQRND